MNTKTGLVKYEPMMKVTTFSGKTYFFPQKNFEIFGQEMETKKFISVQGSIINVSSIDTIDPAGGIENQIESMISGCAIDVQRKVRHEIKMRETKTHSELTETVVQNMINEFSGKKIK